MPKCLDVDGNARLKIVLEYAKGDVNRVREGMKKALKGETAHDRRKYLWSELPRLAEKAIRRKQTRGIRREFDINNQNKMLNFHELSPDHQRSLLHDAAIVELRYAPNES